MQDMSRSHAKRKSSETIFAPVHQKIMVPFVRPPAPSEEMAKSFRSAVRKAFLENDQTFVVNVRSGRVCYDKIWGYYDKEG